MNLIAALAHAQIGYGIRRKVWPESAILHCHGFSLYWMETKDQIQQPCMLLGPDACLDLGREDVAAEDWEAI